MGSDGIRSLDVGDIETLDALGVIGQIQRVLKRFA